ncbi:MAG TPA: ATP-binding protein [Bacteroidetes bacterium]|nr:ATP-binding protein [Bacteroidota bacterium]
MGSNRYIRDLIREGEHQQLDFKYAITDSRKIARTLVAFSNTDGGRLLIGVKDNGRIAGVRSDEEMYMVETAAITFCKPEVKFTTTLHETDQKTVLEVTVPPASDRPYRAPDDHGRWHAYVRVGDENFIANRVLIRTWQRKKRKRGTWVRYSRPERILMHYLAGHESISQSHFRKIAGISYASSESILVNFLTWNILEPLFTHKGIRYKLKE